MELGSRASSPGSGTSTRANSPVPKLMIPREQILETLAAHKGPCELGLVVVGHVDAGKSTLMGRMLLAFGDLSERDHQQHLRNSAKIGKSSFAYAWALDSSEEERERGITIDVAQDVFRTEKHVFHLLDAPGHRDFVPNMISGAAQADAALLVVDASLGAFEAGFGALGQTREHATLLRSLGIQQLIVVVNKLDAVEYDAQRYETILHTLKPFLAQSGFDAYSIQYIPCAGSEGENLSSAPQHGALRAWYNGPTLAQALDSLKEPARQYDAPLRIPVTNVFRSQNAISSGIGVAGRIASGIVQVGEIVAPLPGDATGTVRAIECEGNVRPWAAAGSNVTLYLSNVEQNQIHVGSVLCPPQEPVSLVDEVVVQMLVFTPTYPLLKGTAVEVYHHSADIPGQLVELISLLDKGTGDVTKQHPRVLPHHATATVRIALGQAYPIETFRVNKDMARLLFRMNGETVGAGIVIKATCGT
ncbi:Hbs1p [Malassezia vespertilionis]|uniref:Elongation factor 1 alpha-like protein n=2 Tax=Malassezia vespertilionis TaxID=2020962 RepID=A0A2N1JA06_9BASI|nr:Hbs1p [Malassezia vespertilionis]